MIPSLFLLAISMVGSILVFHGLAQATTQSSTQYMVVSDAVWLALIASVLVPMANAIVGLINAFAIRQTSRATKEKVEQVQTQLTQSSNERNQKLDRVIDTTDQIHALTNGGYAMVLEEKLRIADRLAKVEPTAENQEVARRVRRKRDSHLAKMRDAMYRTSPAIDPEIKSTHMNEHRVEMERSYGCPPADDVVAPSVGPEPTILPDPNHDEGKTP
jgi:hypothetical protein